MIIKRSHIYWRDLRRNISKIIVDVWVSLSLQGLKLLETKNEWQHPVIWLWAVVSPSKPKEIAQFQECLQVNTQVKEQHFLKKSTLDLSQRKSDLSTSQPHHSCSSSLCRFTLQLTWLKVVPIRPKLRAFPLHPSVPSQLLLYWLQTSTVWRKPHKVTTTANENTNASLYPTKDH